jgi:hypothetical protein
MAGCGKKLSNNSSASTRHLMMLAGSVTKPRKTIETWGKGFNRVCDEWDPEAAVMEAL